MKKHKDLLPGEVMDLHQEIALISPVDTPLITLLYARGQVVPAKDITVSWREKELNTTHGVKEEGAEAGSPVKSTRKLKSNICQIMEKVVAVSGTVDALNPTGIGNEFATEVQDRLIELKRDLEHYALNGVKSEEDARQMNGLLKLVDTENVLTVEALKEDDIVDALQKIWDAGAHGELFGFVNASVKRAINKIYKDQSTQVVIQSKDQTVGITVTRIETDFGNLNLVLDRHMEADTLLIVDLDKVELAELRKTQYSDLAKTGDYKKGHIINESTIKLLNSKAGAVVKVNPGLLSAVSKKGKDK